jgi:hypothetical protein
MREQAVAEDPLRAERYVHVDRIEHPPDNKIRPSTQRRVLEPVDLGADQQLIGYQLGRVLVLLRGQKQGPHQQLGIPAHYALQDATRIVARLDANIIVQALQVAGDGSQVSVANCVPSLHTDGHVTYIMLHYITLHYVPLRRKNHKESLSKLFIIVYKSYLPLQN